MTTLTTKAGELMFVPVPKGIDRFSITHIQYEPDLIGHIGNNRLQYITTLSGQSNDDFEIIGVASQLTEEQAKEFLDYIIIDHLTGEKGYRNYTYKKNKKGIPVGYPRFEFSVRSLIKSSGLPLSEDQDVLILKKI